MSAQITKTGDVIGRPVRPNLGIQRQYQRRIQGLIDEMYASILWWVEAEYKRQQAKIIAYDAAAPWWRRTLNRVPAFDASPAVAMRNTLHGLLRQWNKNFGERSKDWARKFAQQSARAATVSVGQSIGQVTGIAIPTTMTRSMNNALQSLIAENMDYITSIPKRNFAELNRMIMESVRSGRQVEQLRTDIEKRFKKSREEAERLARDQTNKAMESLSRLRMQENGITEAVWIHATGVQQPRSSHVEMHGKRFDLAKGMYDPKAPGGAREIQPGELINCHCTKAPVIPGVSRRAGKVDISRLNASAEKIRQRDDAARRAQNA